MSDRLLLLAAGYMMNTHHKPLAGLRDESVTALMDQQFAVDTLVALPAQPPYPFSTVATVGFLQDTQRTHSL